MFSFELDNHKLHISLAHPCRGFLFPPLNYKNILISGFSLGGLRKNLYLCVLLKSYGYIRKPKLFNNLFVTRYSVDEVQMLTEHVREYHAKLRKEIMALLKFSQDFNKQYATDNNGCFDTASKLFNRIRSSIAGTKRVYSKFCPTLRRQGPVKEGVEQRPSVFTHSMLSIGEYSGSLFGKEGYHECVDELCKEMEGFFKDLVTGLKLCRDVMQQEREIRGDFPTVLGIYESSCKKVVNESRGLIQLLEQSHDTKVDEMTQKKSCAKSLQSFVCESFHTVDKSQFQMHAVMDVINKGRRNGLTEIEALLWNSNQEFVGKVRLAISRFDNINPKGQMDRVSGMYKLSAKYVAMLMQWCGITGTGKEKQFVEDYFNKTYNGAYKCLGSSSVNSAKNKYSTEEYSRFCENLTAIISDDYAQMAVLKPLRRNIN